MTNPKQDRYDMNAEEWARFEHLAKKCYEKTAAKIRQLYPEADEHEATLNAIASTARRPSDSITNECGYVIRAAVNNAQREMKRRVDRQATEIWSEQQLAVMEGKEPPTVEKVLNREKRERQGHTLYDVFRELVTSCEGEWQQKPDLVGLRRKEAFERRQSGMTVAEIAAEMTYQYVQAGVVDIPNVVSKDLIWMNATLSALIDQHDVRRTIFNTAWPGGNDATPETVSASNPAHSIAAIAEIKKAIKDLPSIHKWEKIAHHVMMLTSAYCPSAGRLTFFEAWEREALELPTNSTYDPADIVPLEFLDIHYHARVRRCKHCRPERSTVEVVE